MLKHRIALLQRYSKWISQFSRESPLLFAANTSWGRPIKVLLFGVGVLMPFGSLVWIALFFHGKTVVSQKKSRVDVD